MRIILITLFLVGTSAFTLTAQSLQNSSPAAKPPGTSSPFQKPLQATSSADQPGKFMDLAKKAIDQGKYPDALTHLNRAKQQSKELGTAGRKDLALTLSELGAVKTVLGQLEESRADLLASIELFKQLPFEDQELLARSESYLGNCYGGMGETQPAAQYTLQAIETARKHFESTSQEFIALYSHAGLACGRNGEIETGLEYLEKALELASQRVPVRPLELADILSNQGELLGFAGDYAGQKEVYDQAYTYRKSLLGPKDLRMTRSYNDLIMHFSNIGDFVKADEYNRQNLEILLEGIGENNQQVAQAYEDQAGIEMNLRNPSEAIANMRKCLEIRERILTRNNSLVADGYTRLGFLLGVFGYFEEGEEYMEISREIIAAIDMPAMESYLLYTFQARYYAHANQFEKSLEVYEKAGEKVLEAFGGINPEIGSVFGGRSEVASHAGKYEEGIEYADQGLRGNLVPAIPKDEPFSLDHLKDRKPLSAQFLCSTLRARVSNLYGLYLKDPAKLEYLREAIGTSVAGVEILLRFRMELDGDMGLLLQNQYLAQLFTNGMEMSHLLQQQTGETSSETPLFLIEGTKSHKLLKAITAAGVQNYFRLPEELIQRQQELKTEFATVEKNYFEAEVAAAKEGRMEEENPWRWPLFELKNATDSLEESIRKQFPEYHRLKLKPMIATTDQIRQHILKGDPGKLLIEYCWVENGLYALAIHADGVQFVRVADPDSVRQMSGELRAYLTQSKGRDASADSGSESNGNNRVTKQTAVGEIQHALYKYLLAPFLEDSAGIAEGRHLKRLVIIPDGPLCSIPFETLLTSAPDKKEEAPYLIRKYAVAYGFSSTLLLENYLQIRRDRSPLRPGIVAFSPDFSEDAPALDNLGLSPGQTLTSLPRNAELLDQLAGVYPTTTYKGKEATEAAFKAHASGYAVLHLNTHGFFQDSLPMHSGLVFLPGNDSAEDGILYTRELFNMAIQTDLAVLSACNTGFGTSQPGENLMSMSRGFAYAGCPSMITSLWEQAEASTAIILGHFYTYLGEGLPKDEALRQAKLLYLEQSDQFGRHPAYWAHLISVGNTNPVHLTKGNKSGYFWVTVLALVLMIGGALYTNRKKVTANSSNPA